ncbi:MAG TPA: nitrate ABC transporter ATP-binding protein [Candidatus Rokubacteria bacterium]|nr:nitrate ABC transporter ATP-binding protein [Candidatus Rokubacteria bacterium]
MLSTPPAAFSRKIVVESLSHAFDIDGRSVPVLTDVSLEVAQGEFLAIVGPSGCGKSTLLNIVSGLFPPTTGRVTVDGAPVEGINPRIGYMFARDALLPWRTSLANVAFGPELAGEPADRREARARDLLRLTGLAGFEGSYPSQLSQGMRQRVSLARTLARNPDILLMDEPFGALDAQTKLVLEEEFLRIWERDRKTVIFVTHDLFEAIAMADRVAVFSARPGRIKSLVALDLPRPRSVTAGRFGPRFQDLYDRLWDDLRYEVVAAG